jgi:hypothetical protein
VTPFRKKAFSNFVEIKFLSIISPVPMDAIANQQGNTKIGIANQQALNWE